MNNLNNESRVCPFSEHKSTSQKEQLNNRINYKNTLDNQVYSDVLHKKAVECNECTGNHCTGSFMRKDIETIREKTSEEKLTEAKEFIDEFYESEKSTSKSNTPEHTNRWNEIRDSLMNNNKYELTFDELQYGVKTAWRNSTRCIGRIYWNKLELIDCRHVKTTKEMYEELCKFLKYVTNNGSVRLACNVFPQRDGIRKDFRIWNSQLLNYAGYQIDEDEVIGDRNQLEFTNICLKLGWKGKRTRFDILPWVLQANGEEPELFEVPPELVLEVPISHPEYDFKSLNLKWYGPVTVSTLKLDIGGCEFSGAPFSGFWTSPELGRNLCDKDRYHMLKDFAEKMNLDTNSSRSLWQDKALIEANYAALYSYQLANVSIIDHHTISEQFKKFFDNEHKVRGGCPSDWIWIVSQLSGHLQDTYHLEMINYKLRPFPEYQPTGWEVMRILKNYDTHNNSHGTKSE